MTFQTVEYMANELITKYSSDSTIKAVVDKYDFYVFPIVNVDGAYPFSACCQRGICSLF